MHGRLTDCAFLDRVVHTLKNPKCLLLLMIHPHTTTYGVLYFYIPDFNIWLIENVLLNLTWVANGQKQWFSGKLESSTDSGIIYLIALIKSLNVFSINSSSTCLHHFIYIYQINYYLSVLMPLTSPSPTLSRGRVRQRSTLKFKALTNHFRSLSIFTLRKPGIGASAHITCSWSHSFS